MLCMGWAVCQSVFKTYWMNMVTLKEMLHLMLIHIIETVVVCIQLYCLLIILKNNIDVYHAEMLFF